MPELTHPTAMDFYYRPPKLLEITSERIILPMIR
jgi:hypothetical protein